MRATIAAGLCLLCTAAPCRAEAPAPEPAPTLHDQPASVHFFYWYGSPAPVPAERFVPRKGAPGHLCARGVAPRARRARAPARAAPAGLSALAVACL